MKREFKIGTALESNTEYVATEAEYHVYARDTVQVCDDRYVALRANDEKAFNVFIFIKGKRNITLDFGGATIVMHGKIQPFLIDLSENITIKNCNININTVSTTVDWEPGSDTYGLNKNRLLKHYSYSGRSLPKLAQEIRNDGVKNTFGWVITTLVEDGKRITTNSRAVTQQGICQINENNFVFVSFMWGSYVQLADYMIGLGCKTGFALDGGGSVQLVYKPSNGSTQRIITVFHRALPDIIYFHQ